ncbi:hypothetical protein IAR50_007279 [Cryptococcus sp. DSM 104548]
MSFKDNVATYYEESTSPSASPFDTKVFSYKSGIQLLIASLSQMASQKEAAIGQRYPETSENAREDMLSSHMSQVLYAMGLEGNFSAFKSEEGGDDPESGQASLEVERSGEKRSRPRWIEDRRTDAESNAEDELTELSGEEEESWQGEEASNQKRGRAVSSAFGTDRHTPGS